MAPPVKATVARTVYAVEAEDPLLSDPEIVLRMTVTEGPLTVIGRQLRVLLQPGDLEVLIADDRARAIIRDAMVRRVNRRLQDGEQL